MLRKILTIAMCLIIAICALTSCVEDGTPDNDSDASAKSNLGDYNIKIASCRFSEDFEGEPVVIVKYTFTNNSEENASFLWSVDANAFQDGIELEESYFLDDSANFSSDNQDKEIKPGAKINVEVAYLLLNTENEIEIEVSEYLSFSDKKITKSFPVELDSEDDKDDEITDEDNEDNILGDFDVVVNDFRFAKTLDDEDAIIVEYAFTNNSNENASFMLSVNDQAFQNGIELEKEFFLTKSQKAWLSGRAFFIFPGEDRHRLLAFYRLAWYS